MMAAIGDGGGLNRIAPVNERQPAEMVEYAARRRILQDLNRTVGGAGGEAPVVGNLEIAAGRIEGEGHADSILNIDRPRDHVEQAIRVDVLGLIPSRHASVARGVRRIEESTRNGGSESKNAVGFVDRGDLSHVSGQTLELAEVIGNFDPVSNLEAQDAVAPDLLHRNLGCNRNGCDRGRDAGVVARPFELCRRAASDGSDAMNLYSVEPVFQTTISAAGGDDAGVIRGGRRDCGCGQPSSRWRYRLVPESDVVSATVIPHVLQHAHLPEIGRAHV